MNVTTCKKAIVTLVTRTMKFANDFKLSVVALQSGSFDFSVKLDHLPKIVLLTKRETTRREPINFAR